MAIKVSIGKLEVPLPFTRLVQRHVTGNAIEVLSIKPEHPDEQRSLSFHHRDPFDRLIIAQAIQEGMPVVSRDEAFPDYPAQRVWKET
jgi:PIN domain nuclease of toxin-antitoxin system